MVWQRLVLICVAILACSACDGYLNVRGRVENSIGKPIIGAQVNAYNMSFSVKTDDLGCFQLSGVTHPSDHQVPFLIQAADYQTYLGQISYPKDQRITFRLIATGQDAHSRIEKFSVDPICDDSSSPKQ